MAFVLYRSSAGSGKTYTLVKEYLKLVLENPEKFKHSLAVTFTNKAAGEMKERIIQALKNLAKKQNKDLEKTIKQEIPHLQHIDKISAQLLTTLLHNYSDFAIMTIDSFIHKVIKAFALEIGLPLNFGIDLNYERMQTYVIEKLLAGVGKDEYITDIILEFVFSRVREEKSWNIEPDIKRFENDIFNEKNIDWVKDVGDFDNTRFYRTTEQLQKIRGDYVAAFNVLGTKALDLMREAGLTVDDFAYKKSGAAGFLQKCADLRGGGEKKFQMGSRFRNNQWAAKSTPAQIQATIENLLANGLEQISREIVEHYDSSRSRALTAAAVLDNIYLTAIINQVTKLIDQYKKNNNVIPISEFNVKVYEIVKNSPIPFIYSILGEKYNHYLVDEFQDTSKLQWENLFPLIDNAMGSDFFSMAVGDGKQSIYRWRGGSVEIMEEDIKKKILPEQLTIKVLDKNFRSRKNIVDFNNRFFEKVSAAYRKENVLLEGIYSDIVQDPAPNEGGFVSLQFIEETAREEEADPMVLEKVKTIIIECLLRGYEYNDIAILVRENKQGQKVAENLLENGIPVVSPDSLLLAKVPLIAFLIDILTYLGNPKNKINEFSIIHFPCTHRKEKPLDSREIGESFQRDNGKQWELSPEVSEFFNRRAYLIRMPVYEVIEEVTRIFKLDKDLDFRTTGYLQAFLDIVSNYTAENSVDLSSFLDWWEFNKDEFAVAVPEGKAAVKIMTIHKAKGLEFPIVIVPYAHWDHKPDKKLWLKAEPPLPTDPPLDMPMPVNYSQLLEETYFQKEYKKELEKVLIDNINLLYVAFTRAEDNLYIIAQRKKKNENYLLLDELAAPMMKEDQENEGGFIFGGPVSYESKEEKPAEIDYAETDRLLSNKWYSKISIRRKSSEFWRFDAGYRAERRNWGILVHQVLAKIQSAADVSRVVNNIAISGDIELEEKDTLEQKINEIFEIERVKEWFDPETAHDVFTESPIITAQGILRPDRVIAGGENVKIIDFKTGAEKEEHEGQMTMYIKAVQAMGYPEVEGYLFYLEDKKIKKI